MLYPLSYGHICWSEQQDLNLRPPAPKAGALPGCAMLRRNSIDSIHTLPIRVNEIFELRFGSFLNLVVRSATARWSALFPQALATSNRPVDRRIFQQ